MQRKVLVATVATAPLLVMAFGAFAETQITNGRTTPIATATANNGADDDVTVTTNGSIKTTGAGPLITLNSNNKVSNAGALSADGVSDVTGIQINGGTTGSVTNTGVISFTQDVTNTDTDNDGDLDGAFAQGSNRYGVRLTGPGAFTGNILNDVGGSITVNGNNSYGISLESALVGNLTNNAAIQVTGDNGAGVLISAPVTGKVTLNGSVTTLGQNTVGVGVDSDVNGAFVLQGSVSSTGYRYTTRPADPAVRAKLDADDLMQGGSALRITGNVTGGVLLDIPPVDTDTTKADEDNDGVPDVNEGSASLTTYGGAPALQIGSDTRAVTIGAVGTGDDAYGLITKGLITANGVYDGVAATGVRIGGAAGQATTIAGGFRQDSAIQANSFEANSTGLNLTAGASMPTFWNRGSVTSVSTSEGAFDARGVVIDAGANLGSIRNAGSIVATLSGEKGNATAILDNSGTLGSIENTGKILAFVAPTDDQFDTDDSDLLPGNEVVTGKAVAIDVRKNTTGFNLTQSGVNDGDDGKDGIADADADGDGVDDGDEPAIIGDVLFGSGDDTFKVLNGSVLGAVAFGAGADSLVIDGGSIVQGALTDSDGRLSIDVGRGALVLTNAETINATSLNLGADSKTIFTADPTAGTATKLVIAGNANIASGAQLGLRLTGLLQAPTSYTVITADHLTAGTIDQGEVGDSPYLYVTNAHTDANNAYIDVRRRTAAEAGLNRAGAQAYDAIYAALGSDTQLADAFLAQNSAAGFNELYQQMMPDQGEGLFAMLQSVNQQISAATALKPDLQQRYGPDSIWVQEINGLIRRTTGDTLGSDTKAFGFVGGYEAMGDAGGALGLTLAFASLEEHDTYAKVGEQTTASLLQGGAYWRRSAGAWRFNVGGGAGYSWFDGDRRFISGDTNGDNVADLVLANSAKWNGVTLNGYAGAAYEAKFGRYFARPEARLDYVWLREGDRKEKGGGAGFDLLIDERTSSNLSGEAGVAFGAQFGRDVWWRPEVRVGYRQTIAGNLGDTVAQFGGGSPFTLTPGNDKQGALTAGFALRAGTGMSYVALEGGLETAKRQKRYNMRLTGRAMF